MADTRARIRGAIQDRIGGVGAGVVAALWVVAGLTKPPSPPLQPASVTARKRRRCEVQPPAVSVRWKKWRKLYIERRVAGTRQVADGHARYTEYEPARPTRLIDWPVHFESRR